MVKISDVLSMITEPIELDKELSIMILAINLSLSLILFHIFPHSHEQHGNKIWYGCILFDIAVS